jgi:acetyl esterase/lipase
MRHIRLACALVVCVVALAGCDLRNITPPGSGAVRYRDQVFTGVTKTSGITYATAKNQDATDAVLKLDVFQPTGDKATARPAIVWIHGGSFCCGDRTSGEIVDQATVFAKKGYVGFSIDYRLNDPGCTSVTAACIQAIRDAWHDAQTAVRWVRDHAATYGIDTTRIAAAGTSAGAITALNVGYGANDVGPGVTSTTSSSVRAAVSLSGAGLLTTPDPGEAPALEFHGTADPLVPYSWSTNTMNAALKAGDIFERQTWVGAGHVPYQYRTTIINQESNFLYWTMDLQHAAQ